jgi:hypothetical protein
MGTFRFGKGKKLFLKKKPKKNAPRLKGALITKTNSNS